MQKQIGFTAPLLRVGFWALLVGGYSWLVYFHDHDWFRGIPGIPSTIDAALSFAMALLIAFRINRAYERWWEARSLWGTLVNVSRNLAVKVRSLRPEDEADRKYMRDCIMAFCMGLRDHLRDEPALQSLPGFENDAATPKHVPSYVARRIYERMQHWNATDKIGPEQLWILDQEARVMLEVSGACEKIKTTLMSISWRTFIQQCIVIYLFVLPWGLIDDFKVWTIPVTVIAAYVVIAGEGIAQYVERPFGKDEDHLDLELIIQTIDRSVTDILLSEP